MSENVFADDWVDCLESHYMHVIRNKDKVTEPSLSVVMHSAGFSDKQLAELRVRATMHVDDTGTDFVPDLDVLSEHDHEHHHDESEAVEAHIYNIPIDVPPAPVEEVQTVETEMALEEIELPDVEPEADELRQEEDTAFAEAEIEQQDPDEPQQLSLF
ncbi:MAG: hypothetical protein GC179_29335 [Anaerolineaceae bacterium]|nr:hypothetical protein [Anaerolineaceae bacterium]